MNNDYKIALWILINRLFVSRIKTKGSFIYFALCLSAGFCHGWQGNKQPHRSDWLHSHRLQGPPRAPRSPLPAISICICHDPCRKCWDDGHYYDWSPVEHTNVFLPRQPLLHWSLLLICYCTQGHEQLLVWEKVHFLCRLYNPVLSLCPLHCDWRISPGSHGLWPLHCHLQPTHVLCPDVNTSLHSVGGWFLFLWLLHLSSSVQHDIYFILLFSDHWPLLLWCSSTSENILFWPLYL